MSRTNPSLRRLAQVVDALVDPHLGIVRHVEELPLPAGAPDFFHFYARACNTGAFCHQQNFEYGGGASTDRSLALAKAIGEVVERYCAALHDVDELPYVSRAAAPFRCVDPKTFALLAPNQYAAPGMPFVPFEDTTPVRWTPALDLLTGEEWHVPAAMVYLPYSYREANEAAIVQPISTGLACHGSLTEAALSGACEVIERDAFTITWQARLSRPQIRPESLNSANADLLSRFERTGAGVTLLNITMDAGIPTILSVLRSPSPHAPALVFAAATALKPEEAVRKSLEELTHTRYFMQQVMASMSHPLESLPGIVNIVNQDDHLKFWCDHANARLSDFIFASPERIDIQDIPDLSTGNSASDLNLLCQRIRGIGHQVLLVDLSTSDVAELGLSVVRALIPGFHPLQMGFALRSLGGTRLWEVPQKLGYSGITTESGDNPLPHPFP